MFQGYVGIILRMSYRSKEGSQSKVAIYPIRSVFFKEDPSCAILTRLTRNIALESGCFIVPRRLLGCAWYLVNGL